LQYQLYTTGTKSWRFRFAGCNWTAGEGVEKLAVSSPDESVHLST
jgi:hypothetical protein